MNHESQPTARPIPADPKTTIILLLLEVLRSTLLNAATKADLTELENKIMASQQELAAQLQTVAVQIKKVNGEIGGVQTAVTDLKAEVERLKAIIAAGPPVSQELTDAVKAVADAAQEADDQIPDQVIVPPVTV